MNQTDWDFIRDVGERLVNKQPVPSASIKRMYLLLRDLAEGKKKPGPPKSPVVESRPPIY